MLGVTNIWTYVIGTAAIILLPGPNSIFVLTTAARYGVRAGYRAAAGVFLGDWVLMGAAALGVASLLRAYPPVFMAVKYAGAVYLAYVGTMMAVSAFRRRTPATPATPTVQDDAPVRRPFRRALVISLLNPKAILFFISFFIQFVDPDYPYPALSFLVLGAIAEVVSFTYLTTLIFGGSFLATQFRQRRKLARTLTTGVAAVFIGFAAKLATASLG
jgi:leucine efflux protein